MKACSLNFLSLLIGLLLSSGVALSAPSYNIIDLGTLGGRYSDAYAINDSGQVVGRANTSNGETHAFLYSNGAMTDLDTPLGSQSGVAYGINYIGQVVGDLYHHNRYTFLYSGGAMTLDGILTEAHDINDHGQVVGQASVGGSNHAVISSGGVVTDLGALLGGVSSRAYGVNNNGQVVGLVFTNSSDGYAFLYSNGVVTNLGTLGGRGHSAAYDINSSGQVVGSAETSACGRHAFLYSGGVMTDLSKLCYKSSVAWGLNDSGQVVGYISGSGSLHAFLYSGGEMTDLNDLIDPLSGWTIMEAYDINKEGDIAAVGFNPSVGHRALLLDYTSNSVPEPAFLALFGVAIFSGLVMGRRKRRRKELSR